MSRKKKEPDQEPILRRIGDPPGEVGLQYTDEGNQRLLEVQALFYQNIAEDKAGELPDGEEKQEMLRVAEMFKHLRPSVQFMDRIEHEQRMRQWEADKKAREDEQRFITKELNRMASLPEPIFILDLPDEIIQKLVAARFDTVGKVLFGVQVATHRVNVLPVEEDWEIALHYSRNLLIKAVGQEGYNLIGARLIQYGYLQRDYFLSALKNERKLD
jgi:hypothetical protein